MPDPFAWSPANTTLPAPSWLLATPRLTLTAHGGTPLPTAPGPGQFARLARTAARHLARQSPGTIAAGLIPFDEDTPAHLCLTRPHRAPGRTAHPAPVHPDSTRPFPGPAHAEPPPDVYLAHAAAARDATLTGPLTKVVLARTLRVPVSALPRATVPALLARLAAQEPGAHLFAATLPAPHDTAAPYVLLGATPETLLARRGRQLTLRPLAGTAPRHPDPARDRDRARSLLASAKDRHEHQIVVDALRARLAPLCTDLDVPRTPSPHATSRLWHLSTTIRARLRPPPPDALALAALLHPTPAVCGTPTAAARDLIRHLEPVPRGYYTGLVGWQDQSGDGHWVIALRCGLLTAAHLRLYAGAGIVPGSDPAAELAETQAKFTTMLDALTGSAAPAPPTARYRHQKL
ncbi:isochorismate synthase [Streptomyces sp. G45]|uniref:isochorismate synthase n=1 Tax=Streptomyces sp. G45 TaxID=3406627 RepID=UPI003C1D66FD